MLGTDDLKGAKLFAPSCGSLIAELTEDVDCGAKIWARPRSPPMLEAGGAYLPLEDAAGGLGEHRWRTSTPPGEGRDSEEREDDKLDDPMSHPLRGGPGQSGRPCARTPARTFHCRTAARLRGHLPVFPGTNCEYDTANACLRAGIEPEILVVRNLTADLLD